MNKPLFDAAERGATLSDDGLYRYDLWRRWGDGPSLGFVMLNPSTADANEDDPTIRRCIGFAKREGCDGIRVANLFAFRSTDPQHLAARQGLGVDVVGPENDQWLARLFQSTDVLDVVAAWGAGPSGKAMRSAMARREGAVIALASLWGRSLLRFDRPGPTQAPHPLYLRADLTLSRLDGTAP